MGTPQWFNRDRFVLSAGHGSMLQYSMLHLCGYDSVSVRLSSGCRARVVRCYLASQQPAAWLGARLGRLLGRAGG